MPWGCWSVHGFGWCGDDLGLCHWGFDVGPVKRSGDEAWASAMAHDLTICFPERAFVACEIAEDGMPVGGIPAWPVNCCPDHALR